MGKRGLNACVLQCNLFLNEYLMATVQRDDGPSLQLRWRKGRLHRHWRLMGSLSSCSRHVTQQQGTDTMTEKIHTYVYNTSSRGKSPSQIKPRLRHCVSRQKHMLGYSTSLTRLLHLAVKCSC